LTLPYTGYAVKEGKYEYYKRDINMIAILLEIIANNQERSPGKSFSAGYVYYVYTPSSRPQSLSYLGKAGLILHKG
jgi:hypothetical protein